MKKRNALQRAGQTARLSIFVVAFVALTGCSLIGKQLVEKPKVALSSVNVKDVGVNGATVVFGVEVDNPNSIALTVDAVRYEVEIGGKPLTAGSLEKAASVPAKDKAIVPIPVTVKYSDVFSSLMGFLDEGKSQYRVKGEAKFGFFTIPFDQTGELKLKK